MDLEMAICTRIADSSIIFKNPDFVKKIMKVNLE